jgi:sulfur carrier protein
MKIHINGEPRDLADLKTLADLVSALGLEPRMILLEHNGQATRRADWAKIPVAENDRVEILQVAAGG